MPYKHTLIYKLISIFLIALHLCVFSFKDASVVFAEDEGSSDSSSGSSGGSSGGQTGSSGEETHDPGPKTDAPKEEEPEREDERQQNQYSSTSGDPAPQNSPASFNLNALNNLSPSLFTGGAAYSVPIAVPPGRKGIQPNVALTYSSQSGNDLCGLGWSLDLGSIERSTKKGAPKYDSSDTFIFKSGGSTQELVNISGSEYRAKIEGAFMKFSFEGTYWTVKDKSGITYYFGQNSSSQINNGSNIFKWCLDRVQDALGNYMTLTYIKDNNQIYPDTIDYTGFAPTNLSPAFQVKFIYEDSRPDPISTYRPKFLVKTTKRLKNIIAKQNNSQIRRYQLNYSQSPSTNRSLLTSIAQYGSDDQTTLPAITFNYQQAQAGWQLNSSWTFPSSECKFASSNKHDDGVRLYDLNLDGLTDIIKAYNYHNAWSGVYYELRYAFLNTGNGWQSTNSWVIDSQAPLASYRAYQWADLGGRLADLDGDGWLDSVYHRTGSDGGSSDVKDTFMSDKISGWPIKDPAWLMPESPVCTSFVFHDNEGNWPSPVWPLGVQFIDINSDGLVDITQAYGGSKYSYINNGPQIKGWTYNSSWNMPDGDLANGSTQFSEVNGDGLVDFVISQGSTKKTYIHNGSNWTYDSSWNIPEGDFQNDGVQMLDVNSDGLDDILIAKGSTRKTYINNGTNWTRQTPWDMPDGDLDNGGTRFADVNGDSLIDLLIYYENDPPKIYLAKGPYPDILSNVSNGIGGNASLSYQSYKGADNTQAQDKSKLSFPVQVLTKITSSDGQGNSYSTSYSYDKGEFNFTEREFRGFGKVKVTDVEGNYSLSYFLQGDYDKGRPLKQEAFDASGKLYTKSENIWTTQEPYAGYPAIKFIYLSETNNYTYDGDSSARRTKTQYAYEESPQYGNPTRVIDWGEVDSSSGSDIGIDKRTSTTEYTHNTNNWILSLPSRLRIYNIYDSKLSEKWFYYDNNLNHLDSPIKGLLTKEEVELYNPITSLYSLLSTRYSYDAYGNLLTATDANNHTTTTTYDTTYYIYPLTVTNALGHTVKTVYLGINETPQDLYTGYGLFGQVKYTTDPNNLSSYNMYDSLGRLTRVIGPNDDQTYPLARYQYDLTNQPVKVTKEIKAKQSPSSFSYPDYYSSYSFYDGLGRLIESKSDAEPDPATGGLRQVIVGVTKYNTRGLVDKKYLPYFVDASPNFTPPNYSQYYSSFQYDGMGRVIQSTNPDNTYSTTSYSDWVVSSTDENSHYHTYYYDAYQRLIKVEEHNQGTTYTTLYEYDAFGNLSKVTDNQGNITQIFYDSLGRKIRMLDPDMGVWNYEYDNVGNLTKQIDAAGQELVFTYDNINRLTKKTIQQNQNVVYEYDNPLVSYSKGRLTKVTYAGGSTEFFYDNLGREIQSIKTVNSTLYTVNRAYDALDRLATLTYPDGEVVTYTYNPQGIETVNGTQSTVNVTYIANIDYSPTGQILKQQNGNGTETHYTYDPQTLRLEHLTSEHQGSSIQDLTYSFDNVGNISGITDSVNTGTQTFQYDDLNRLTYANGASYGAINYSYDSIGNILTKGNLTYNYNNSRPHAVSSYTDSSTGQTLNFNYDANGNLQNRTNQQTGSQTNYFYDYESHLTKTEQVYAQGEPMQATLKLDPGWNFFSLPLVPDNPDISSIFSNLSYNPDSDSYTKLQLHNDGPDGSTNFKDETGKTVTANGSVQIDTAQSKFGGASALFTVGEGIDAYTKLALHNDGPDGSTNFKDEIGKTVTANGSVQIDTAQSKFGGASGLFTVGQGIDAYTKLALHFDGADGSTNFKDSSLADHNVFTNENAQIDTAQSKFGGASGLFDGNGSFLTIPDSGDWNFGAGDFTIDLWAKFNSTSGSQSLVTQHQDGENNYIEFYKSSVDNKLSFIAKVGGVVKAQYRMTADSWSPSGWHHLALVRNGSNLYIFIDGVSQQLDEIVAIGNNDLGDLTGTLQIGAYNGTIFLNGWLDEFRISKGIARWTENFTVPQEPYSPAAANYLSIPDSDDWNFGAGDWTIDCWVRFNSLSDTGLSTILHQDGGGVGEIYLVWDSDNNRWAMGAQIIEGSGIQIHATDSITTNTWYHIAWVRNGDNSYFFRDGVLKGSDSKTGTLVNPTNPLRIGSYGTVSPGHYFNGWLDEFRISKGIARWTSNFTPPTPTMNAGYEQVSRYRADTNSFEHYVGISEFDEFAELEYGRGYAVYVDNPSGFSVTINGTAPAPQNISLVNDWNLIPYPYLSQDAVQQGLGNLQFGVDYDLVLSYNQATGQFDQYPGTLVNLDPKKSYYLRCLKPATWNIQLLSNTTEFYYDGDGGRVQRVSHKDKANTTTYIGSLFETTDYADEQQITQKKHIFAGSNRVASIEHQGSSISTHYFHGDHLGSSNLITDASGQQVSLYEYSPFGEVSYQSGSYTTDIKYTGKIQDDTGLYYYGARYYDPVLGRFISPDTIIQAPFDPQSLNRYSYCRNNPINLTDPTGHKWSWKKFWNSFAGAFLAVIVGLLTYGAGWGLMAVGFWSGLAGGALTGGLEGGWKGALIGAAMGGALGALGGWAAGVKYGGWIIGGMIAGGVANTAVSGSWDSFVGGITGAITGAVAGATYLSSGQPGSFRQKLASQIEQRKQAERALNVNPSDNKEIQIGARRAGGEGSPFNHMFTKDGAGNIAEMGEGRDGNITLFEYNINDQASIDKAYAFGDTPKNTMDAIKLNQVTWSDKTTVSGSAFNNMISSYKGVWSSQPYVGGSYNSNYAVNTWVYGSGGEIKGKILTTNRPSFAGKYYEGK